MLARLYERGVVLDHDRWCIAEQQGTVSTGTPVVSKTTEGVVAHEPGWVVVVK